MAFYRHRVYKIKLQAHHINYRLSSLIKSKTVQTIMEIGIYFRLEVDRW